MKKLFLILFLLAGCTVFATNHYFSTAGNNANSGLTPLLPKQTLVQLNADFSGYAAGDSILLKAGDTFYGSITISKSGTSSNPIVLSYYGKGAKPVITGFTTISGWQNEGGGIYSKVIKSDAQTNMVLIDGLQKAMGRYPDTGYLTFESYSTNTSITDNTLGTSINWTGAEAAIRKTDYQIDRCTITNHTGNTLTYTSLGSTAVPKAAGFGYFIQNDLRTLTTYGEWFHNPTTGKFYMYFGAVGPTTKNVKVATLNYLINAATSQRYITISNINFAGSIDDIFLMTGSNNDYWNVNKNTISFAGKHGIEIGGGTGSIFDDNKINNCNNTGIKTFTSSTITNNTISNIGLIPGQPLTPYYFDIIYSAGNGVTIKNNILKNGGGSGVYLGANGTLNSLIQCNRIDSVMLLSDDGAGIYTSGGSKGGRLIDKNIISNVIGNSDGTNTNTSISCGIYLDEPASNISVTNNTVFDIVSAGIKLHRANKNTVVGNTCYNTGCGLQILNSQAANNVFGNIIKNNVFFAKTAAQNTILYSSFYDDLTTFGTADSNYYARPIDDNQTFFTNEKSAVNVNRTLASWQSFTGQDTHSKKAPKTIANVSELSFYYNYSAAPIVVSFSGLSKMDVKGTIYNNSATLPPYESKVLFANGTTAAPGGK